MPSHSTLSVDEKAKVKSTVSEPSSKIKYVALARIHYAHPQPTQWSYTGLQGALVFCRDNTNGSMYFKLVNLDGTRGVIWSQELYKGIQLNQDRAFFLSFEGDKCMIGLVFVDESEAKTFNKKVKRSEESKGSRIVNPENDGKRNVSKGGKISKSMVTGPKSGAFIHVAHMGYDPESGFTSKGVDPSWTALLGNLESIVPKEVVAREMEYIKNFVREYPQLMSTSRNRSRRHADGLDSSQMSAAAQPSPTQSSGPPDLLDRLLDHLGNIKKSSTVEISSDPQTDGAGDHCYCCTTVAIPSERCSPLPLGPSL